jgi:hypothetical protein
VTRCDFERSTGDKYVPLPKSGYWVDRSDITYAGTLYRCLRRSTCAGVKLDDDASDSTCWLYDNFTLSNDKCESSKLQCTTGATGPLCG